MPGSGQANNRSCGRISPRLPAPARERHGGVLADIRHHILDLAACDIRDENGAGIHGRVFFALGAFWLFAILLS